MAGATDLRHAKVVELVCESCGFKCCADGGLKCEVARFGVVGFCTREEYERRHVESRRQVLGRAA